MCRPVTCRKCQKTTWAGCGQHISSVKASVPPGQWCTCGSGKGGSGAKANSAGTKANSASGKADGDSQSQGFFSRLFSRSN
ncbi:hypothetical protein [Leucobacter sp. OH1287]|uniref:hypothetical protein n=1 Tax=Leucobacter sp. OH1287 TaxID=2491049 RepID=UPI000F5DB9AA|nr:hypothetical protein [Leucobacter sp. OH1287]RRD61530.1 hypothetical protein EII30_01490 [Leucobacter sp. OH1287]